MFTFETPSGVWTSPLKRVAEPLTYGFYMHREDKETTIYDFSVRPCAAGGCPAVMLVRDQSDTEFTKQWQYFLYAINKGMSLAAIMSLMGRAKALFNNGGLSEDDDPRQNWLTGKNLTYKPPKMDKLRTFSRNTHAGTDDGRYLTLITFDGNRPPPLKPGKVYPQTLAQVNPDDYLYGPWNASHLFLKCNNIRNKSGGQTSIFPFDNGIPRSWEPDREIYTYFPFVSNFKIVVPLTNWRKLAPGERVSPYRRVS